MMQFGMKKGKAEESNAPFSVEKEKRKNQAPGNAGGFPMHCPTAESKAQFSTENGGIYF